MDAGRCDFNPRSWGLYSYGSVSLSMISVFTFFIACTVGWSGLNKVTSYNLSPSWLGNLLHFQGGW